MRKTPKADSVVLLCQLIMNQHEEFGKLVAMGMVKCVCSTSIYFNIFILVRVKGAVMKVTL